MNTSTLIALLWKRRQLARRDAWTRRDLEDHQTTGLRELREYASARSPFYARFHHGLEGRPLCDLPVLSKAALMEHFDELVTDREVRLDQVREHLSGDRAQLRFLDRYWVAATAGSTGTPGIFLHDADEWTTVLASYARANDWAHVAVGLTRRLRVAVVSSRTPWHQSAIVGATLESRFVRTLRLDATDPIARIVAELGAFQPESLVGYASMLRVLAVEQLAGRLRITPRAVMSASEVLTPDTRERIRSAWGVEPFDVYAATEPAGIASECDRHGALHLYEDLVITEIVDEKNRPVPPGVVGAKVLVTVLFRRTQPLIRYEMSDRLATLARSCECGRPFALVSAVEGREEDVLQVRGVSVHPNVFHRVLERLPVDAWQVVQEGEALLRVNLVGGAAIDDVLVAREIAEGVEAIGAKRPHVVVAHIAAIPRTPLGKAPLVRALKRPQPGDLPR